MFLTFLHSAIRFSTVFLFGSTGETITERSGHLNLGIPGIMCMGAVGGCIGESIYLKTISDYSQINGFAAVIIGILFAMMFAGAGGLIYAFLTVTLRSNQNVSGLAMTTFGVGLTNFLIPQVNRTGFYYISVCFTNYAPGADKAGWFSELFLTYGCLVYIAIVLAIIVAGFIKRSRTGLNLRAVGENPGAADAAGINVIRYPSSFSRSNTPCASGPRTCCIPGSIPFAPASATSPRPWRSSTSFRSCRSLCPYSTPTTSSASGCSAWSACSASSSSTATPTPLQPSARYSGANPSR